MEQERMELWNVKDLQPPPLLRCRSPLTQIELDILTTSLKEGIDYFSNQPHLHREAALLSRLIYRMKMKFRSSKDFKILEKINNALLNYLRLNITQTLRAFAASVSVKSKVAGTFLPTRNIFDFVLIRMQGLAKLLVRIIECCKIACEMHNQRMRLGHFWKIAIIIYGISSRIFIICKNMIKFTCNLYTKLFSLRFKFANVGVKWLPNNYVQPKSLNEWLGISWEELEKTVIIEIPDEPFRIISYFNLIDDDSDFDDDIQISDEYILVKDDTNTNGNENHNKDESREITTLRGFDENVDTGEVLTLSDTDNAEFENNNNTLIKQDKEISQQLSNGKSHNDTNPTTTSFKKRVVKIIKRKKIVNKQESVINLDDSNEDNLDDSVIFVGSSKLIESHSKNGSPTKKKLKKRKADPNCIGGSKPKRTKKNKQTGVNFKESPQQQEEQPNSTIKQMKKKKQNGVKSEGNPQQQQNSTIKQMKKKKQNGVKSEGNTQQQNSTIKQMKKKKKKIKKIDKNP